MFKILGCLAGLVVVALAQNTCESIILRTSTLFATSTVHETLTATETETVTLIYASAIVPGPVASGTFYYSQLSSSDKKSAAHSYVASSMTAVYKSEVSVAAMPTAESTIWVTIPKTIYTTGSSLLNSETTSEHVVTTYYVTETSTIYSTIVSTIAASSSSKSPVGTTSSSVLAAAATAYPFSSPSHGGWNTTRSATTSEVAHTESLTKQPRSSASALPSVLSGNATIFASSSHTVAPSMTIAPFSNSTTAQSSISSSMAPKPTICGESGNFTLNWDDEPIFDPSPTDPVMFPPVFNPYHHLFFSNGYAYAPPPDGPFKPISPPHMAVFLPNASSQDIGSPSAAGARPGELGAGPRAYMSAYWFNIASAYIGCDNGGPDGCLVEFVGFKYDSSGSNLTAEIAAASHSQTLSGCPGFKNCTMTRVTLPSTFTALSGLQIVAKVNNAPVVFWMDDLSMGWYNNTCEAGLLRQMSRK